MGHGHNWKIRYVRLDHPAQVSFEDASSATRLEKIVQYLAASSAEDWLQRWTVENSQWVIDEYLDRVSACEFGSCDQCMAGLNAWYVTGERVPRDEAFTAWRQGELLAHELVRRADVWRDITALADALLETPTIDGERAHAILGEHLEFGSLKGIT